MSDDYKCPRCGHGAVMVFAASGQQMRGGHRCGNRKCWLPVLLWDEWQEMKDRIAKLDGTAKEDDAHRAASAIEILEGIVNARSRELEHLVLALDSLLKSVKGGDRNPDKVSE